MADKRVYRKMVAVLVAAPLAVDFVVPQVAKATEGDSGRFMYSTIQVVMRLLGMR